MKFIELIVFGLFLGLLLLASLAWAHEGPDSKPAPAPAVAAPPATGTHDALTWFTDPPLVDQNGKRLQLPRLPIAVR
ncbi:hypothetical protein [Pseudomonas fluorescens]|uniref:Uncharacterized protein n=1 Tax=Pseudomonas fluorescens TaxID=294 RepID=A0A5E7D2C0_PSEFL|nr:hypothetical protein [Pseudomonas fluorescens]VVO11096.1 hypothetical protein PS723_03426 [Pseudomonas fluorescens]